jgi:hypothetical protein
MLIAALALSSACGSRPPDESNYVEGIASARGAKDAAFRMAGSPVPAEVQAKLLPLVYFPIDPLYAVPAAFREVPPNARQRVEIQTSTHQTRQMERLGTLNFTLQGQALKLAAYREIGQSADHLFVPFTDLTTGKETYQAGRFLDIDRSATGIYVVDFNTAYNPYCYYNPTYDCPYPPKENRLPIAIRAGEKIK